MKNILMIAYHFPPIRVSSGIQRTLKFAQYLLDHDWKAQVLTVNPRVYERVSEDQIHEIPTEVIVKRAFALDTAKHLAVCELDGIAGSMGELVFGWCLVGASAIK
jgi:hypothetical protein